MEQGVIKRDGYSGFKFFQCIEPQDIVGGTAATGTAVDTQGFETVTFVVNVGCDTGGGALSADNRFQLRLEHGNSIAGGGITWSEVYPSQMLHSVVGAGGAYSTLNSGIFQSIGSCTAGESYACQCYAVGYVGPRRWARIVISDVGIPSTASMGCIAILGLPANWPVSNTTI
jgi:hypothetical protein